MHCIKISHVHCINLTQRAIRDIHHGRQLVSSQRGAYDFEDERLSLRKDDQPETNVR